MLQNKKLATYFLLSILILGFMVRLYRFDGPIADWHSWRQGDTSAVSRNFVENGFDILHPRFDDLSNVPSGMNNPEGYRFVEFPIYNIVQAVFTKFIGVLTLEEWGRLVTIIASLSSSYFLYRLVRKYSGEKAGLATAFFFTFLPYNIYYGRTILPDPSMVAAILGGIFFFDKWIETKGKSWLYFFLMTLLTASAVLIKPYALFYGLVYLVLGYQAFGFGMVKNIKLWLFGLLCILPFIGWRLWMQNFPEGIPANAWLLNGNNIRFRPAFFRWMGYERLIKLISGYVGIIVLFLGIFQVRFEKAKLFFLSFFVSSLLYVVVFATGNVQHDYYQIVIMPSVAILFGLGIQFILGKSKRLSYIRITVVVLITTLSLLLSWNQVKDYFNINNRSIVIAGEAVDRLTPKDAKIIASYMGDTTFLYHTKRKGWTSFQNPLPEMIEMGASYLVFANPNQSELNFAKEYKTVARTKDYVIYNLKEKP